MCEAKFNNNGKQKNCLAWKQTLDFNLRKLKTGSTVDFNYFTLYNFA